MALHANLAGSTQLHKTKVATNAGSPAGSVTPSYTNELLWDTTNNKLWYATGATSADWIQVNGAANLRTAAAFPSLISNEAAAGGAPYYALGSGSSCWSAVHYPGLANGSPNWINVASAAVTHYINDEDDGSGAWTSFVGLRIPDTKLYASSPLVVTLIGTIPATFNPNAGWGSTGLRIALKYVGDAGSSGNATFDLEVYEPTTGAAYSSPVRTQRTVTATTAEASYTWVAISGANLGGLFLPGDPLIVVLTLGQSASGGGAVVEYRIGKMEAYWGG